MNVQTHTMDPRIARIHYADYRKRVRAHRELRQQKIDGEINRMRREKTRMEKEDEALLIAYRALTRGQQVLFLPEVMRAAGVDEKQMLPNLAIAKADTEWCFFSAYSYNEHVSFGDRWGSRKESIRLDRTIFRPGVHNTEWRKANAKPSYPVRAMVPKVPPTIAPVDLSKYYILFEPKWEVSPPHLDPILLSRAHEHVFVVVATWDMTPIEAAVLGGRGT